MSKKRPDYTKFMRKPSPLELGPPPRDRDDVPHRVYPDKEEDIPWAEVILEPEHVANLARAGGVPRQQSKPNNAPGTAGQLAKNDAPARPQIGYSQAVVITDATLDLSNQEGQAYETPFMPPGIPVGAAPPLAVLMIIALVLFFLSFQ